MVTVTVNGTQHDMDGCASVETLLESLSVKEQYVAVARNGEVVPRTCWSHTMLSEGDSIELVRMVGGGSANDKRLWI